MLVRGVFTMLKIRRTIIFLIIIIILSFPSIVRADEELDEEFDFTGMNEFLQSVTSEANKIPDINSRHAVVYDRATREHTIWQKRKRKMQNGINHKDNDSDNSNRTRAKPKNKNKSFS